MEFCEKGDLFQKISHFKKNDLCFEEKEIWSVLVQILLGLKALHERKVFHRDLKSANIFLCKNGSVKIGDMNVSKIAKKGLLYTQTGTPYYASPEVWKDKPYDHKSDIWSLGCIIYEMCTLKPPFRAENMEGLFKKVTRGVYDKLPSRYSSELSECIKLMLHLQPSHRVDCRRLLAMPFVQEKLDDRFRVEADEKDNSQEFLSTIKIPENLIYLTQNLPQPNYEPIRLRKTTPMRSSDGEYHSQKPMKSVFLSLHGIGETRDRSKESVPKQKQCASLLPVLKSNNLKRLKHAEGDEQNQNKMNHCKPRSLDRQKKIDVITSKNIQLPTLECSVTKKNKTKGNSNLPKGLKSIKLDPIK